MIYLPLNELHVPVYQNNNMCYTKKTSPIKEAKAKQQGKNVVTLYQAIDGVQNLVFIIIRTDIGKPL